LDLLNQPVRLDVSVADSISEVKGLFTRTCKQDQWDWFTVWTQLGRPGRKNARDISDQLGLLRRAITGQDQVSAALARARLRDADAILTLRRFLDPLLNERYQKPGLGYVYILSTRSHPRLLKIGYTLRSVEQRVKEINSATGIVEPYGVRAVWIVKGAPQVERAVHDALAGYRVRSDREFFELAYGSAFRIVGDIVHQSRREQ
jgi:T5orf172 domain